MGESPSEAARREVDAAREQLGATVEALAYRANAPKRAKDRVVGGLMRTLRSRTNQIVGIGGLDMGLVDVATLVVKPAVTGTMRARQTKANRNRVAKKQWIAYIGVAVLTTLLTKALNEFIEQHLGDESG